MVSIGLFSVGLALGMLLAYDAPKQPQKGVEHFLYYEPFLLGLYVSQANQLFPYAYVTAVCYV